MRHTALLSSILLVIACEPDSTFPVSIVEPEQEEPEQEEPEQEEPEQEEPEQDDEEEGSAEEARGAWPNGVVPYELDPSVLIAQETIEAAVARFESETQVRWVPRTDETDYVIIRRNANPRVSRAAIGRWGGVQYIALGTAALRNVNVVLHEMGHTLGRTHEHQRPDRDQHIIVHLENAPASKARNLEIRPAPQLYSLQTYDDVSIMHYSSFSFSNNRQPTMTRLDGSLIEGMNQGLTPADIATFDEIVERAR